MSCAIKKIEKPSKVLLLGVSVIVLAALVPAHAETERTANQNSTPHYNEEEIKEGLDNVKESVSNAVKGAHDEVEKNINKDQAADITPVKINQDMTATGMLEKPVLNTDGDRIARVKDIILDKDGNAVMIILIYGVEF